MINSDYRYTNIYSDINDLGLNLSSTYIYSYSVENRSKIVNVLKGKYSTNITFVELELLDSDKDIIIDKSSNVRYSLRSKNSIKSLIEIYKNKTIYVDISGLNNRVSAALLNNLLGDRTYADIDVRVVYAEPESYKIKI